MQIDDLLDEAFKNLDEQVQLEQIKTIPKMDQNINMSEIQEKLIITEEKYIKKSSSIMENKPSSMTDIVKENCEEIKVNPVVPLYENIDLLYQNTNLPEPQMDFPLGAPVTAKEPPKEKPPPPPVDDDDANPVRF